MLRRAAARSDYATLIASTPALLTNLNAHWRQYVAGGRASFPVDLVTTTFSGLVIKPVQEREEVRMQGVMAQVAKKKLELRFTKDALVGEVVARREAIIGAVLNLSTKVREFVAFDVETDGDGNKKVVGYRNTLAAQLNEQMRTRAINFAGNAHGADGLIELAEQTFRQEQKALETATAEVEAQVGTLTALLTNLNDTQQTKLREAQL